ncbi:cytochrome c biogenesis protein CCS1, chloroplastic-like [Phalaenopsis equestris]|uniref:cytochrome c biogenesis protein CCS1, chloroplastic-like n=1 Tax=Phalaenopsis equestris TaxID=78828 RepID=UPI0009E34ACC|nr:cytochrome c biogenesis protein CCS1, chloroplastic-like [Phalaenopsis equestris]XP_020599721.1 cytochrome c biogenesis protein CCS1, chloroplastic-like [Phalaenopsis equestris]
MPRIQFRQLPLSRSCKFWMKMKKFQRVLSYTFLQLTNEKATAIDQGEAHDFYLDKFPEENPLFWFVTWRWVLSLGFDHMFTSPIFLGMLALLAASLMSCTYTTQIPIVKVARRWSFIHSVEAINKQEFCDSLPHASIQDLGVILMGAGYEVNEYAIRSFQFLV